MPDAPQARDDHHAQVGVELHRDDAEREARVLHAAFDGDGAPVTLGEAERGRGVGRALLLSALHAQRAQGYAYAIIGGVGPADFYAKTVGAVPIAGSTPGIYDGMLPRAPD